MKETASSPVWVAPRAAGPIFASVRLPGSKSLSARELLLSAIGDQDSEIYGLLYARDTDLMVKGLTGLGATITPWPPLVDQPVQISPIPGIWRKPPADGITPPAAEDSEQPVQIECGLAGTVMRFLPALAVALGRSVRFTADDSANARPLLPLLAALEELGATWKSENPTQGLFPFVIHPPKAQIPREVSVDASASSQFVSALLLSAPLFGKNFTIRSKTAEVPSLPHLQMTLESLTLRGIDASGAKQTDGTWEWSVEPSPVLGQVLSIEPDLSNAGPFLAAVGIAGGRVSIPGWPTRTTQAGDAWRSILPEFGLKVELKYGILSVQSERPLKPIRMDFSEMGELVPTVAALAACADGTSVLSGLHHLRGHETDRLEALSTELKNLGIHCEITPDEGLLIEGISKESLALAESSQQPVLMHAYGDHRMATFAALMGLYRPVQIDDIGATSKTMPDFPQMWTRFLGVTND